MSTNPSEVRPSASRAGAKIALFIDVANADGVDFRALLASVRGVGPIGHLQAVGDFRQRHLDPVALELYALGIDMTHAPSWLNGGANEDGTGRRKRSDDRLLEKAIRDLLASRDDIDTYAIAISDADIIPACHAIQQRGKQLILFCPNPDTKVGHVLRMCDFDIEPAPMLPVHGYPEEPSSPANVEAVVP